MARRKVRTLRDLKPDPANVNKGTERGAQMIDWSLSTLGAGRSVLADADGVLIAGNKTVDAAAAHNLPIRVVETDGSELVVVQRTDLRLLGRGRERERARKLALADNRTSEVSYDVDVEALLAHAKSLDLSALYDPDEIETLLASLTLDLPTPGDGGDEFDPDTARIEPRCHAGDLWVIDGKHRLLCGDSTRPEEVARLMNGQPADLLLTDPPYNVSYVGKTKKALTIENDAMSDPAFRQFLVTAFAVGFEHLRPGGAYYIWHADSEGYNFRGAVLDVGQQVRQCLIWVKNSLVLGRQDYHWRHEPCLYGWKSGAAHRWHADRSQSTVLEFDRPTSSQDHPTMKPVALFEYQIKNSAAPGEVVLDLFGGSGTTLIACHRTVRLARLVEVDPKYCDVILARAEAEGLKVKLDAKKATDKKARRPRARAGSNHENHA